MTGVAIIGTGVISERHIEAYAAFHGRCRIVALCDLMPEKAELLKEKYHLEDTEIYSSFREMVKRPDIQLVSICTPPFTHAESAVSCMRAGKHVLVEKPMASSLEECDEMIRAQKETGCYLGVISQNRYLQDNRNLKNMIASGAVGRVLFGQVESLWFRGREYYDLWWRGTWEKEGGGCTLNHAVHQIDLLNWIMGSPKSVTAVLSNTAHDNAEVEDVSAAVLTYDSGAVVTVTASLVTHGEGQRLVFQCERAGISSPWQVKSSRSDRTGFPAENRETEDRLLKIREEHPPLPYTEHAGQIDTVLRFLEGGETPPENSMDGRLALEVITAVYQAGFTGRAAQLPILSDSPFYTKKGFLANVKHFYEKKEAQSSEGAVEDEKTCTN